MNNILATTITSLVILFASHTANCQTGATSASSSGSKHSAVIIAVFGEEWVSINPDAVTALEDCFANRISYKQEPLTVNDKYPLLSSFAVMNKNNPAIVAIDYSQFNPETFCPITYNLPFFSNQIEVIRVDGTDYIVVIQPIQRN